jgi:hypothetical protein
MKKLMLMALLAGSSGQALAEPDLSGIWMLKGLAREGELRMTETGLALQADYDLLVDDPSLYCEPASTSGESECAHRVRPAG